jgi:hypothetical protein
MKPTKLQIAIEALEDIARPKPPLYDEWGDFTPAKVASRALKRIRPPTPKGKRSPKPLPKHVAGGNCWAKAHGCKHCGDALCDVCHTHEEPRGECGVCQPCPACRQEVQRAARVAGRALRKAFPR